MVWISAIWSWSYLILNVYRTLSFCHWEVNANLAEIPRSEWRDSAPWVGSQDSAEAPWESSRGGRPARALPHTPKHVVNKPGRGERLNVSAIGSAGFHNDHLPFPCWNSRRQRHIPAYLPYFMFVVKKIRSVITNSLYAIARVPDLRNFQSWIIRFMWSHPKRCCRVISRCITIPSPLPHFITALHHPSRSSFRPAVLRIVIITHKL